MQNIKYGVNDKPTLAKAVPLALQHVFSAFAGTMSGGILMANGMGMSLQETALVVQCAMLICGVATIIQSIGFGPVGARLPIVTGGSYTLITPMIALALNPEVGISGAFGAAFVGSIVLIFLGPLAIRYLHKYFTPVVTGSVVLAVGMCLMGSAFQYAVNFDATGPNAVKFFVIAVFTLLLTLFLDSFCKGYLQSLSILIAILVGYILCIALKLVDFTSMAEAGWLAAPKPLNWGMTFHFGAIVTICIIHIVTVMENIGDTTGVVTAAEDRLPTRQELMRTIRGDGLGSVVAALFNGLPVISGSPNVGIICMTGVASRYVTFLGGIIIGVLAFFPKVAQILALTPSPVLGGVLLVSFGTIASSGIRVISMGKMTKRNITILAMAVAVGIGGNYSQPFLSFLPPTVLTIVTGISGTALTALLLNFILPKGKEDVEADRQTAAEAEEMQRSADERAARKAAGGV